jgi:hypothetical protein
MGHDTEGTEKPDKVAFNLMMWLRHFTDFDGLTPEEAYAYVFEAYDPGKSPITFKEDVAPGLIENIGLYRDGVAFLGLLKAQQPLKLTQKGNLPVASCRKLVEMNVVGSEADWFATGRARREQDCHRVHLINILCQMAGLTRKVRGNLRLTKHADSYLVGNRSLEIYKRLFLAYVTRFNWGYEDLYPEAGSIQAGSGFSIYLVSKYGDEPAEIGLYADKFAAAFPFVIDRFPGNSFQSPQEQFVRCYYLRTFERFLCRFGLVDARVDETGEDGAATIVKSDLFDNLMLLSRGPDRKASPARPGERKSRSGQVYQFKITLRGIKPSIWRRIQVPSTYTFWDLHVAIQDAMGWRDCHLHEFVIQDLESGREVALGIRDSEFLDFRPMLVGWQHKISHWFSSEMRKALYAYDFGDGWEHDIRLERILPRDPEVEYPKCLDGERACPPEDVGGPWGYHHFLKVLADPSDPEHQEALDWLGGEFDPAHFDLGEVRFDNPRERLKSLGELP